MENLRFDTGVKEFALNGNENAVVRINPTDANQLKSIYDALTRMEGKQNEYESRIKECGDDGLKALEVLQDMDKQIRAEIDLLFGVGFSQNAFGMMNLYAYGDGLPVWFNFIEAVINMFDVKLKEVERERNPRIEKYTKKYRK